MADNPVADEALKLPREPVAPWIRVLAAVVAVVWLGVLAWQIVVLPEQVPVQFEVGGPPTSWSSKLGALVFPVLMVAAVALPAALVPALVFRAPRSISAPNRQWWTATPARLRRFERLLREDLMLLGVTGTVLMVVVQVQITLAARSPDGQVPPEMWLAMVVALAGLLVPIVRMSGAGGRYDQQPELG